MDVSKQIIELNLVGLDNFLNIINTHTPRFIDRKTSKLDEPQRSSIFPYYNEKDFSKVIQENLKILQDFILKRLMMK